MTWKVRKSTRHQKIIGDYGESLVCNWLSRSGFEVSIVDHTGIDIVAYNPENKTRYGLTIKSRTRNVGKETTHVNLFLAEEIKNIQEACNSFGCDEAWIVVYIETAKYADLFLVNLDHYLYNYYNNTKNVDWKMSKKYLDKYVSDENVLHLHMNFEAKKWL